VYNLTVIYEVINYHEKKKLKKSYPQKNGLFEFIYIYLNLLFISLLKA